VRGAADGGSLKVAASGLMDAAEKVGHYGLIGGGGRREEIGRYSRPQPAIETRSLGA
jgi:hypothetical protein